MTIVAVILAAALVVVVVVAGEAVRRALRSSERRERGLLELLKQRDAAHAEVLDRVMYASGKPWQDTADRPEPATAVAELEFDRLVEDPVPGGLYAADELFDQLEDELRSDAGDTVFVPADQFDTRDLEVT